MAEIAWKGTREGGGFVGREGCSGVEDGSMERNKQVRFEYVPSVSSKLHEQRCKILFGKCPLLVIFRIKKRCISFLDKTTSPMLFDHLC